MNFKIDNLQYCNWSREIFEFNRSAGLDAVHVTIVYHEDYDELLVEIKKSGRKTGFFIYCIKVKANLLLIHFVDVFANCHGHTRSFRSRSFNICC